MAREKKRRTFPRPKLQKGEPPKPKKKFKKMKRRTRVTMVRG